MGLNTWKWWPIECKNRLQHLSRLDDNNIPFLSQAPDGGFCALGVGPASVLHPGIWPVVLSFDPLILQRLWSIDCCLALPCFSFCSYVMGVLASPSSRVSPDKALYWDPFYSPQLPPLPCRVSGRSKYVIWLSHTWYTCWTWTNICLGSLSCWTWTFKASTPTSVFQASKKPELIANVFKTKSKKQVCVFCCQHV